MGNFIHQDQIAEKLEIARTMGFVTDYRVGPGAPGHRPGPAVRVSHRPHISDEVVRDYLIRLLHGLVADHQIIVSAPYGSVVPVPEAVAAAA